MTIIIMCTSLYYHREYRKILIIVTLHENSTKTKRMIDKIKTLASQELLQGIFTSLHIVLTSYAADNT